MNFDIPQNVIPDMMSHHARHFPNKIALVMGDQRVTWGEMNRSINRIANRLLEDGIERGDKVAFVLRTSLEYFYLLFGAMKAGASAVPLSTMLSAEQVSVLLNDAGAKMVFTDAENAHLVRAQGGELHTVRSDGFFTIKSLEGWRSMPAWLGDVGDGEPPVRLMMDDEATISYSSGTTGFPKGIVYSHRARQHLAIGYAGHMHIDGAAVGVATTPLYSNGTSIIMFPTLMWGGTLVFMESFDAGKFLELVERERATHTFMVPTQFVKLMAHSDFGHRDISSMKIFLSAGSPMLPDLKREVMEKLGGRLSELYGLSEGGAAMIRPDELVSRPLSTGRPLPGFEFRIIGADDGELKRGEVGEIVCYGGWAMRCYHNRLEQTESAIWRDEQGRSFVRTGDIGKLDEDGYLFVVDRKKDMIISGGFNVFPADIEAIVGGHPAVESVAVIGVPHPVWGESPLALVVLKSGENVDPEDLRNWANTRVAKTQRIAAVVVREDFPRNALGKIQKSELRDEYREFKLGS